jgi:hypothetical protein
MSVDLDNPGEHAEWARIIEAKTKENARLALALRNAEETLARINDWCNTYGKHLTPTRADTYGDGVRECKETVKNLLSGPTLLL